MVVGFALTPYRLWSVNTYGFLPWPFLGAPILFGLAVPLLLVRWNRSGSMSPVVASPGIWRYWQSVSVIAVLFLVLWYLLRSHTHFLSDGYIILTKVSLNDPPLRPWQKPTFSILSFLAGLTSNRAEGGALVAYEVVAFFSGLIVILGTAFAALRLFDQMRPRLVLLVGAGIGGYALLFFGFVSNFTLFTAVLALFCLAGLLAIRRALSPVWTVLLLAIAGWLHPLAVAFVPVLLYVLVQSTPLGIWAAGRGRWPTRIALGIVAAGLAMLFYIAYTGDYFTRFLFVPLVPDQFTVEGYWLFSHKHLLDFINLLLLVTPTLPLLAVLVSRRSDLAILPRVETHYFLWLILPLLVLAFLVDPKLGMPRDWDMLTFLGFPLTVAYYYWLMRSDSASRRVVSVAVLGLALSALSLIPRVGVQVMPASAIAMFDRYSNHDFQKNASGRYVLLKYLEERGRFDEIRERTAAYSERAPYEIEIRHAQELMRSGNDAQAAEAFRAVLKSAPAFANAWTNLGLCQYKLGQFDSAVVNLRIADGLNPCSPRILNSLALAYYKQERPVLAERTWLSSLDYDPYNTDAFSWLVVIYELAGRTTEQAAMEDRIIEMASDPSAPASLIARAAKLHLDREDLTTARTEYRRALEAGLDTAELLYMQKLFPQLEVIPNDTPGK